MSTPAPGHLADYPFTHWVDVRFRDLDVLGHVNNAVYSTYFESARIAYYAALTGLPLERLDIILAETTVRFRAPAHFGDRLGIGARVASVGNKSFVMEYAAVREGDGALIAEGRSVLVAYDYREGTTKPVSEEFRAAVARRA